MSARTSRRGFLQTTVGAAGAVAAARQILLDPQPLEASPAPTAARDRVRFGMIGIGMQGSGLLRTAITLPGVECAARAPAGTDLRRSFRSIGSSPHSLASRAAAPLV